MLSLAESVRVFESSEDVILSTSRCHSSSQFNHTIQRSRRIDEETEAEKDKRLHPQHPYLMQKHVLQDTDTAFDHLDVQYLTDDELEEDCNYEKKRPMEFVFLSSGEIQSREDCVQGLERSQLKQKQMERRRRSSRTSKVRLGSRGEEDSKEEDDECEDYKQIKNDRRQISCVKSVAENQDIDLNAKTSRQQRRHQVDCRQNNDDQPGSSPSSSAKWSFSSSEDADVSSNDDNESDAVKNCKENEKQNSNRLAHREQRARQAAQSADEQVRIQGQAVAKVEGVEKTATCCLRLDHLKKGEGDGTSGQTIDKNRSAEHTIAIRNKEVSSSGDSSHASRQRPATLRQVSQLDHSSNVTIRHKKWSPKMEVIHLVSDELSPSPKRKTSTKKEDDMVDGRKAEMQKEKQQVLEKTTHLLDEDEQGISQQLRDKVEVVESQHAAKSSETSSKGRRVAREHDTQIRPLEMMQDDRVNELEEQIRVQKADIARLNQDKIQLKTALRQLKRTGGKLPSNSHNDTMEVARLRAKLNDMNRCVYDFLANVERWKRNSKEKLQNHDQKTDLPVVLENVWLDFPQFPKRIAKTAHCKSGLRQREDKLRQTHIKYMELKEMCARQCVREADLQSFINEHRLRGNLIIRKNSSCKARGADHNQEQTQKDQQDEDRRSVTLKMIPGADTTTPASYNESGGAEKDRVNEEHSDNHKDNDDCKDEDEFDYLTTFVQVGRNKVYEHASSTNGAVAQKLASDRSRRKRRMQSKNQKHQEQLVERIQLERPTLAQRYERVPAPTSTTAQRNKSGQQSSIQSMLKECPPGCGSHSSFMHKKVPTAIARASRPTMASRGSAGVMRPWM
ncbi:unnamed protein product [Peronospora belbahrii]|uniref:Uncharacterized protein n=1 Tax=Peronospora belbahrii TaxID=622444 RepID=A0AAU9L3Y0_9STRA|nr:unnamed protein product [Peronospora belbahrii]